jgi:hypothetical protein|tara:strand:- start:70 stop:276 length:207 start_codon:yes stop_codon:yes gene_type:complete
MYYSKTLKQFLADIIPDVKDDADKKLEKELIKKTLLGHNNEPQRNYHIPIYKSNSQKITIKKKSKKHQ